MLHKLKSKISNKVSFNVKGLKFTTTKIRLLVSIIFVALIIKYLFTMSCSWNTTIFSGSTKPIMIDSDVVKIRVSERNLEHTKHSHKDYKEKNRE